MNNSTDRDINLLASHLFRENYGKMVAYLSRKYGYHQIDTITDAVQEAFEAALKTWKFNSIPDNTFAWLLKVASNKLLNKIRQTAIYQSHRNVIALCSSEEDVTEQELEESLLSLLTYFSGIDFSDRNKLIISLYFLCGFGYDEIANALLLKRETVKKVILRSREEIRQFAFRYDATETGIYKDHLPHLLKIIYLLFNEGYKSSKKDRNIHYDLCYEAIRLGKLMLNHCPENTELHSLLALMFFNTSRFAARTRQNCWISIEEQDRNRWDKTLISEGFYHLNMAKTGQAIPGKYYLEALIASVHSSSESYRTTDWQAIVYLYRQLELLEPKSIAIKLNRIIAECNIRSGEELISELQDLEPAAGEEAAFSFYSAMAYIFLRMKDWIKAKEYYTLSGSFTKNSADKNFIDKKLRYIEQHLSTH